MAGSLWGYVKKILDDSNQMKAWITGIQRLESISEKRHRRREKLEVFSTDMERQEKGEERK